MAQEYVSLLIGPYKNIWFSFTCCNYIFVDPSFGMTLNFQKKNLKRVIPKEGCASVATPILLLV